MSKSGKRGCLALIRWITWDGIGQGRSRFRSTSLQGSANGSAVHLKTFWLGRSKKEQSKGYLCSERVSWVLMSFFRRGSHNQPAPPPQLLPQVHPANHGQWPLEMSASNQCFVSFASAFSPAAPTYSPRLWHLLDSKLQLEMKLVQRIVA